MTATRAQLHMLLDRARIVLSEHLSTDEITYLRDVLAPQARLLRELSAAAPAEADFPQAWPMLAQSLARVVGAQQNGDRVLADRWAAVAFALTPLVRLDFDALARAQEAAR